MDEFKILSEEELGALSNQQRREYLKAKREHDNKQLFERTLDSEPERTKSVEDSPTPSHVSEVRKKSNAGRKKKDEKDKKKQMVLTLSPATYERLLEWAESKPRTAPNYVSEFVEEHLNEIIK